MKYDFFEKKLSKSRLDRYKNAFNGDTEKALLLYKLNIELSKQFYGMLNFFEIMFRNAINEHYSHYFSNNDWILSKLNTDFFSEHNKSSIIKEEDRLLKANCYSADKLVASLSLGFWVSLFSKHSYAKGDKTLLRIFPNKQKGMNQKDIYQELDSIRVFRNRIAHYESICFNKNNDISVDYAEESLYLILKYVDFMDISMKSFLLNTNHLAEAILEIKDLIWKIAE
ncbi:MAG: Abi family protein [Fibromonadales bacterium]|nr:Abi family protein [Fibromonadales bacterium]